MNYVLECCVDSVESAIAAEKGGANRFELCANLIIGGTSPSLALFHEVKKHTNTRVNVLLRPRFGDFLYSEHEMNILEEEVQMFKEAGADGVVIGCLNEEGKLDMPRMQRLVKAAGSMNITLHRAFDVCKDPFEALQQCIELGIDTILTSGQKASCLEGEALIRELIEKAEGKIDILAGAGVNAGVIEKMVRTTALTSFHMSGKITKESGMKYRKEGVSMGLPSLSEFEIWQTKEENVRAAHEALVQGLTARKAQ